jgi:hypothetical protein
VDKEECYLIRKEKRSGTNMAKNKKNTSIVDIAPRFLGIPGMIYSAGKSAYNKFKSKPDISESELESESIELKKGGLVRGVRIAKKGFRQAKKY